MSVAFVVSFWLSLSIRCVHPPILGAFDASNGYDPYVVAT